MKRARRAIRTGLLGWVTLASACLLAAPAVVAKAPSERHLRATFVYKFTTIIGWPQQTFDHPVDSFAVCVLGEDPFGGEMEKSVAGQKSHNLPVAVHQLEDPAADETCHAVYVAAEDPEEIQRALARYAGSPTLTIGHSEDFAKLGGMIELRKAERRLRFRINLGAARRAGLEMNSKLLHLAIDVLR